MIRVVLVGIVAFVVGLAGASVWAARSEGPPADQAAGPDSTAVATDSARADAAVAFDAPAAAVTALETRDADERWLADGSVGSDEPTVAGPIDPVGSAPGSSLPTSVVSVSTDGGGNTGAPPLADSRLGKIFTAMQPREAARVLEQMSDHDVRVILGMVTDRQAAAILSNLPPERAAGISREALRSGRSGP